MSAHDDHGSTPENWTIAVGWLIGAILIALAIVMQNWTMAIVGIAALVIGTIAGVIMTKIKKNKEAKNKEGQTASTR